MGYELKLKDMVVVPITRELAREFSEMNKVEFDRPFQAYRAEKAEKRITTKTAHVYIWVKGHVNGTVYRINGQHTSKVIAGMQPHPKGLFALVINYKCESIKDLKTLFYGWDNGLDKRTINEFLTVLQHGEEDFRCLSRTTLNVVTGGLALYHNRGHRVRTKLDIYDRDAILLKYKEFVCWLPKLLEKGTDYTHIARAASLAAIYATWVKSRTDCLDFWVRVRDGENMLKKHPAMRLRKFLLNCTIDHGRGAGVQKKKVEPEEMYGRSLLHWIPYRNGEDLESTPRWKPGMIVTAI